MKTSGIKYFSSLFRCMLITIAATIGAACDWNPKHGPGGNATTLPTKWVNSNLTIVVNSSDSVTLTWPAGANVAYYRVYRSINTTFDTYYNVIADTLSAAKYDDDTLVAGTTYYYIAASINKDGSTTIIGRGTATTPATDK